jgi:AcrR family transcriptional regulator
VAVARQSNQASVVAHARRRRTESMVADIAAIALELFERRGFGAVTVEEIAAEAQISIRTFYRYFAGKEDLLLAPIHRRAEAVAAALASRPVDEPPLHSVRLAVETAVAAEDPAYIERWITVVAGAPGVLRMILGANILEMNSTIAEFLGSRLDLPSDAVRPATLAVAIGAVIQSAQTRWHFDGGDLVDTISEALLVLEESIDAGRRSATRAPKHVS